MNDRVTCRGCRARVERGEALRVGLSWYCCRECARPPASRSSAPVRRVRSIPVDVRQEVLSRDSHRCRWCRVPTDLHLHHILYRSQQGPDTVGNLVALCPEHHAKVHSEKRYYQPLLLEMLALGEYITLPVYLARKRTSGTAL